MVLPSDLISQFVKATKDKTETKKEATVYGVVVIEDDRTYVRLDGSDLLTPVTTTVEVVDGERVTVLLKNHTATITGNISSPSARIETVRLLVGDVEGVQETITYLVHKDTFDALVERVAELEEQIETVDIEAVEALEERITANETAITTINETTIPELRGLISDLTSRVSALENA